VPLETSPPATSPVARAQAMKTYAALPMMFEANDGQTRSAALKFLSRAPGYALFLTDKEAVPFTSSRLTGITVCAYGATFPELSSATSCRSGSSQA